MRLSSRSSALLVGALTVLIPASAAAQASPSGSPVLPSPSPSLAGVTWLLDDWLAGTEMNPRVANSWPTLWFDGTTVNGSSGCNRVHGTYSLDGDAISFADFAPMNRMCIQGLDAQQQAILEGLTSAATIELGSGTLAILDAAGTVHLDYHAVPALENRPWVWLTPGDQPAPAQSVTIEFANGIVSGQAPCNSYSAPYTVTGSTLALGLIASTQMACPDLASETAYLAALSSVTGWSVDSSGDLVLTDASGAEVLRYTVPTSDE